ncbi:MAG: TniQ family protein, partial [Burkholderiales bacterium]
MKLKFGVSLMENSGRLERIAARASSCVNASARTTTVTVRNSPPPHWHTTVQQEFEFGRELGALAVGFLHDETFHSFCVRLHRLVGNSSVRSTSRMLFGHACRQLHHDFPTRVRDFVIRSKGYFGKSPEEIVLHRTVVPFYLPWLSPERKKLALEATNGDSVRKLRSHLGMKRSRIHDHLPLKFCRQCISDDRASVGVSYWHLSHQYPGVWACLKHGCPLSQMVSHASGGLFDPWQLPSDLSESSAHTHAGLSIEAIARLHRISFLVNDSIYTACSVLIELESVSNTYQIALQSRGLTTQSRNSFTRLTALYLKDIEEVG